MLTNLYYIFSVAFSRGSNLIIGSLIAKHVSVSIYSQFVLFLSFSNILINFSSSGCNTRVISETLENESELPLLLISASVNLFICTIIYIFIAKFLFLYFHFKFVTEQLFSVILYSIGFFYISLVSSYCIRIRKVNLASCVWISAGFLVTFSCYLCIKIKPDVNMIDVYSLVWCFVGCGVFLYVIYSNLSMLYKAQLSFQKIFIKNVAKFFSSGFIALPFFIMFYLVGKKINSGGDTNTQAAYFLGLQLFTVAIFIPGVIGPIVVSKLMDTKLSMLFLNQLRFAYLIVCSLWLVIIFVFMKNILFVYSIEYTNEAAKIIFLWQLVAVIASFVSTYIQLFISKNKYGILIAGGIVWFLSVSLFEYLLVEISSVFAVISFFLGYVFLLFFYMVIDKWFLNEK